MILKIFMAFFRIGLIGYGGGPASMPLVKKEFVDNLQIMTDDDLIELTALCNMLPGPMITKVAAVIGYNNGKWLGVFMAVLGLLLPSTVLLIVLMMFFYEATKSSTTIKSMINAVMPVVTVMMGQLVWGFIIKAKKSFNDFLLIILIIFYWVLINILNINVVFVILGTLAFAFLQPVKESEVK